MGAKRPRRRQQAGRRGEDRHAPACASAVPSGAACRCRPPQHRLGTPRAGLLARTREGECPLPATPAFPCRSGTVASGASLGVLTVAGAAPVLHRLPVSVRSLGPPGAFPADGRAPYASLPHCVNHAESRTCRKRTPGVLQKTPRLRRQETGRQGETGPLRVRLRQDRISVDGASVNSGLFRGATAQWPAAWRARRARKPST